MYKTLLSAIFSIALFSNSFSQITLTPTIVDATCNGACNGSINISAVGGLAPFTYAWSNGTVTQNISNLCAGSYTVTVTDVQALTTTQSFTVNDATQVTSSAVVTNASCPTSADGVIDVVVAGGTPPYSFMWSNNSTAQVLTNLPIGTYAVSVIDANGCVTTDVATINSVSNLSANFSTTNPSCGQADGVIQINAIGGLPPFSYMVDGDPLQGTNVAIGLAEGVHAVVVTDSVGCVVDKLVDLSQIKLKVEEVVSADCNNKNGKIKMSAMGGTAPYTYAWNIGGGNTPIADSLVAGGYSVTVTDSLGCSIHKNIVLPLNDSCVGELSGVVFYDLDGDCTLDGNEVPMQYAQIKVSGNGVFYVFYSDANGKYQATLPLGTYIIEPFGAQGITCPASLKYQVNLSQSGVVVDGNDFAVQTVAYRDVSVLGRIGVARPGFLSEVWVTVKDNSSIQGVSSGQVKLTLDAKSDAVTASDAGVISGKVVTWNYTLNQGETKHFQLTTQILAPPAVNIGDNLIYEARLFPATADSISANNVDSTGRVVQGSYDPNDKAVFPNGNILLKDTVLKYTIRFQNTGNDTAFTVVIRDTLDGNLNPYSLRNFASSHSMTPVFVASDVIEFRFDNIYLPDSFVNEPASNGFVSYYVNRIKNIPIGSTVKNQAAIYFDYNLPIFTNTAINTLVNPVSSIQEFGNTAIKIHPNPAFDRLFISVEENQFKSAALFDLNGAKVADNSLPELSVLGLPQGMYVCKVELKNTAVYYTKIIVQ